MCKLDATIVKEAFISLISSHLTSAHSQLTSFYMNWVMVSVLRKATQFAVIATNRNEV